MRPRVVLDTDIGTNIDDAFAVAVLLRHPAVALTVVTVSDPARAPLAQALCTDAGRDDVRVVAGSAAGALVEGVRDGASIVLTIGPLTTLARALLLDAPTVTATHVVSMCGDFGGTVSETNARADVEATRAVLDAPIEGHTLLGVDVTGRCRVEGRELLALAEVSAIGSLVRMTEGWLERRDDATLHDALAATVLTDPQVCSFARGRATIRPDGRTAFSEGDGPHLVATDVNEDAFFARVRRVLSS